MKASPHRIVIYPNDVANITGVAHSTARKLLNRIRKANNKKLRTKVTIGEYCAFMGFEEEWVRPFLQ